jgi:hypothetical protein
MLALTSVHVLCTLTTVSLTSFSVLASALAAGAIRHTLAGAAAWRLRPKAALKRGWGHAIQLHATGRLSAAANATWPPLQNDARQRTEPRSASPSATALTLRGRYKMPGHMLLAGDQRGVRNKMLPIIGVQRNTVHSTICMLQLQHCIAARHTT